MANQKNQLIQVPLNGPLNLDKIQTKSAAYEGFNELNSPLFGGNISPMYKSKEQKWGRPHIDFETKKLLNANSSQAIDISTALESCIKESKFSDTAAGLEILCRTEGNCLVAKNILKNTAEVIIKNKIIVEDIDMSDCSNFIMVPTSYDTAAAVYVRTDRGPANIYVADKNGEHLVGQCSGPIDPNSFMNYKVSAFTLSASYKYCIISVLHSRKIERKISSDSFTADTDKENLFEIDKVYGKSNTFSYGHNFVYEFATGRSREFDIGDYWPTEDLRCGKCIYGNKYIVACTPHIGNTANVTLIGPENVCSWVYKVPPITEKSASGTSTPDGVGTIFRTMARFEVSDDLSVSYKFINDLTTFSPSVSISGRPVVGPNPSVYLGSNVKAIWKRTTERSNDPYDWNILYPNSNRAISFQKGDPTNVNTLTLQNGSRVYIGEIRSFTISRGYRIFKTYSNGIFTGLSIEPDNINYITDNTIGLQLTLNGLIDESSIFLSYNYIVYKEISGTWKTLAICPYEYLENREDIFFYIDDIVVLRTPWFPNAFTKDLKPLYYSVDWNNRFNVKKIDSSTAIEAYNKPEFVFGGQYTDSRALSVSTIASSSYPPSHLSVSLLNSTTDIFSQDLIRSRVPIDIFKGTLVTEGNEALNTKTLYECTIVNNNSYVDIQKDGIGYTFATFCPGVLSKVSENDFNRVFFEEGNTFYMSQNFNGHNILVYDDNTILSDIENIFSIQGQLFVITKDYIYSATLSEGKYIALSQAITKISGLKFCGCLPTMAVFYSALNQSFYSFTADNRLSLMASATGISSIYLTRYNPETFASYLCTNKGILVLAGDSTFILDITEVEDIYFKNNTIFIETNQGSYAYKYDDSSSDFEAIPIKLKTKFYSPEKNNTTVADCIYINLFNDKKDLRYIKFKVTTLNQGTYSSIEKEEKILPSQWDKETGTALIRYQPQYQRNAGIEVSIETDADISDIGFSVSPIDTITPSTPKLNI